MALFHYKENAAPRALHAILNKERMQRLTPAIPRSGITAYASSLFPIARRRLSAVLFLALLVSYVAVTDLSRAARRFFWFDEICTVAVARQETPRKIWDALKAAADTNPPLFYMVEAGSKRIFRDEQVGYRFPSVLAFAATSIALFVFARRLGGSLAGIAAATFPLLTPLHEIYAIEARPYALIVACLAIALALWQDVERRGRGVLLAVVLAIATSLHYYAIFGVVPLALGEAVLIVRQRKVRLTVWAALLCAFVPLGLFWPLLSSLKTYYGANFWAKPHVSMALGIWDWLLNLGYGWGIGLALSLLAGVLAGIVIDRKRHSNAEAHLEERVVILGLLCLPTIAFLITKLTHGGLTQRYGLATILGFALAIAYLTARSGRRVAAWAAMFFLITFAVSEGRRVVHERLDRPVAKTGVNPETDQLSKMIQHANTPNLPVVISNDINYLPDAYYRPANYSVNFLALIDYRAALAYRQSDSADRALTALAHYLPLNVREFDPFIKQNPRFLLLSSGDPRRDWLPKRLIDDGYVLRPVGTESGAILYFVEAPSFPR